MRPRTALDKARKYVTMSYFGGQFVVSVWDPDREVWVEGQPKPYHAARANRSDQILIRAGELLGLRDPEGIVMGLGGGSRQEEWMQKASNESREEATEHLKAWLEA